MSRTKTFQVESDFGDLMDWGVNNIETEEKESIYNGAEPSMTVETRLKKKVRITITETQEL